MKTFRMTLAVAALVIGSVPVMALTIPGGGPAKSDCYNGFEVTTNNSVRSSNAKSVTALACDNTCTFKVMACVGLSDSTGACTATALNNLKSAHIPMPTTFGPANACGAEQDVTVTLKKNGKKANKAKFRLKGTAASARPKVDNDVLVLKCVPNSAATGCGGQGQAPVPLGSAANFVVLAGILGTYDFIRWAFWMRSWRRRPQPPPISSCWPAPRSPTPMRPRSLGIWV